MSVKKRIPDQRIKVRKTSIARKFLSILCAVSLVIMFPMAEFSFATPPSIEGIEENGEGAPDPSANNPEGTDPEGADPEGTDPFEDPGEIDPGWTVPSAPENPGGTGTFDPANPGGGIGYDPGATIDPANPAPSGVPLMPLAAKDVSNWAELRAAMADTGVDVINLTSNIQRTGGTAAANDLPAFARNLTINGGGYTLDFRDNGAATAINRAAFVLTNTAPAGTQFTLKNIEIVRPNGGAGPMIRPSTLGDTAAATTANTVVNGATWTVNLEDLKTPATAALAPSGCLVTLPGGVVNGTGEIFWDNSLNASSAACSIVNARYQNYDGLTATFRGDSASTGDGLLNARHNATGTLANPALSYIKVTGGSNIIVDSVKDTGTDSSAAVAIGNLAAGVRNELIVDNSTLDIRGRHQGDGTCGVLALYGQNAQQGADASPTKGDYGQAGGGVYVRNKGNLKIDAYNPAGGQAVYVQMWNSVFSIDGAGSSFLAQSFTGATGYCGTMRFYLVGDQSFSVTNGGKATVDRKKNTGTGLGPAIRMGLGVRNGFYVSGNNSEVIIKNEGRASGVPSTANGALYAQAAISFDANFFTFDVSGFQSTIELWAPQGAAVAGGGRLGGTIKVGKGAVFIADGNINSVGATAVGIFGNGANFNFSADEPLYYDFTNHNPANGVVVFDRGGNTNCTFKSTNSDLAVWGNGLSRTGTANTFNGPDSSNNPVNGNPFKSWSRVTYTLSDPQMTALSTSDSPYLSTAADNFGTRGTDPYRRISGNNARAIINDFLQPTNADMYHRATGVVPEGLNFGGRPLWDDGVFARFYVTKDGVKTESTPGQVRSFHDEDIYLEEAVDHLQGVLRYDNGGKFLKTGDQYQLKSVWRGSEDVETSPRNHMSNPDEFDSKVYTVIDVLPPVPAVITSPDTGKAWIGLTTDVKGTWLPAAQQEAAEPHNPDPATKLYAVVNTADNYIMDGGNRVEGTLNADGTWDFAIPDAVVSALQIGDKIYFVLEDANGNKNPLVETPNHDTKMPPAPFLVVNEPDLTLTHTDKVIGLIEAQHIASLTPAEQYVYLKNLIDAKGTPKGDWGSKPTSVSVSNVDPAWGSVAYYADEDAFTTANPNGKEYTVKYQSDHDPTIYRNAKVTVTPSPKVYIKAYDFAISINNATLMMNKPQPQRDAQLIELARAEGRLTIESSAWSAANVEVTSVAIPNPATEGDWDVTFHVKGAGVPPAGDNDYTITIKAKITIGLTPEIVFDPNPILVWSRDPADRPVGYLLPSEVDYAVGARAYNRDGQGTLIDITPTTKWWDETGVDLYKTGSYTVKYEVTNEDNNTMTAYRMVLVNIFSIDGYWIDGASFVKQRDKINALDAGVLADIGATAWKVDAASPSGKAAQTANVISKGTGTNIYGAGSPVGTYDIVLGITEAGDPAKYRWPYQAVVVTQDELVDGKDKASNDRYTIVANNATILTTELANYAGPTMTDPIRLNLINKSSAEAWWLTEKATHLPKGKTATFPLASLSDAGVYVVANDIPANAKSGESYRVTFGIIDSPEIRVQVTYSIGGTPPTIDFLKNPLKIPFVAGGPDLTRDQIMSEMIVDDAEDGRLEAKTTYTINGNPNGTISSGNVGVYKVTYNVVDSDNMDATKTRSIVIDDGRFVYDDTDKTIIGAKNFVAKSAEVQGTADQVRSWSRAVAYDYNGDALPASSLYLDAFPPQNYTANAAEGVYNFTWKITGKSLSKPITGTIINADVIFKGGDNDQYAMTANHFWVPYLDAVAMMSNLDAELLARTDAKVIKLVDSAPNAWPVVEARGGFQADPEPPPSHPHTLTLVTHTAAGKVVTSPLATEVKPVATVRKGPEPKIELSTPLEVWIGEGIGPAGSITAAQYTDMYDVTADDGEGNDITANVIVTPVNPATGVDKTKPGIYTLSYSVTNQYYNPATEPRVVVVNDGSYVVGKGRILYARSFVTKLDDVPSSSSLLRDDVLNKSSAALYDGTTGNPISLVAGGLSSVDLNGYSKAVDTYTVTINANDTPSGLVSKVIKAQVVGADVIGPDNPPPFGPVTYVYGNNINQTVAEAEATAAGGNAEVLKALAAAATKVSPSGATSAQGVKVLEDMNGYLAMFTSGAKSMGIYKFRVTDTEDQTVIILTITIAGVPSVVEVTPKPLKFDIGSIAPADLTGTNLNRTSLSAGLNKGLTATCPLLVSPANPTGDVRDRVVQSILDVSDGGAGVAVTEISALKAGVYQVTYTYTDDNYVDWSDTRAVVVNDGRYWIDDNYILEGLSFVINKSKVATGTQVEAQLLSMAEAQAWTIEGVSRSARIQAYGGYSQSAGDYTVTVGIVGYAALTGDIKAKVIEDRNPSDPQIGDGNGANGVRNSVIAYNFRINLVDAKALQAKQETDTDYINTFITRSGFAILDRTNMLSTSSNVTKQLVSTGGFKTATLAEKQTYDITFRSVESPDDPTATITIKCFVDSGLEPVIAPPVRYIWIGSGSPSAAPAGTISVNDWNAQQGKNGVRITDDYDNEASLLPKLKVGTGTNKDNFVESPAGTTPVKLTPDMNLAWQDISYAVTDSDYLTGVGTGKVMVTDKVPLGDYMPLTYSFVKLKSEVNTSDSAIMADTAAKLWRTAASDPVPVNVSHLQFVQPGHSYTATVGDYPITISSNTPEAGYSAGSDPPARETITAKVVDRQKIDTQFVNAIRYTIVASDGQQPYNKLNEVLGTTGSPAAKLIELTGALAWQINGVPVNPWDVVVVSNGIPANAVPNGVYPVTFGVKDQTHIQVTVNIELAGIPAVITFDQNPLVIDQVISANPVYVTTAELKAHMSAQDTVDANVLPITTATVAGGIQLDKRNIGVFKVTYSVTNSSGLTTTAYRPVIITDGRYVWDENDDAIIGARDYLVASKEVDGSQGQARSLSYAEAYTFAGDPITPAPSVTWTGQPTGYVTNADAGDYSITWVATGRTLQKTITAHVTKADVVDPGNKDSNYALSANHFRVNKEEANEILKNSHPNLIVAADVKVIKLVPAATDKAILVSSTASFAAVEGVYQPITFRLETIPVEQLSVGIKGTVSQGEPPVIKLSTPLEIWIGSDPNSPRRSTENSIEPHEYVDAFYGVTVTDLEDDRDGIPLNPTYTADATTGDVDKTKVGIYKLTYDVIDSDNNHPDPNHPDPNLKSELERIVVVNDGRYKVGKDRVLYAESFVTMLKDVTSNVADIDKEILSNSNAKLTDGRTNVSIASDLSVSNRGGYSKAVGVYSITIAGVDRGTAKITTDITGEVVDAEVIKTDDGYYIFGNNIDLEEYMATDIINSPLGRDAALLDALGAGARKSEHDKGTLTDLTVAIHSDGGFTDAVGTYKVTIKDSGGNIFLDLTVRVGADKMPEITATPIPLEYQFKKDVTDNLSRTDIMKGVVAKDFDKVTDLTSRVVINPDASGNEVLPTIAWNTWSVTPITYKVTNDFGHSDTVTRALIVNDGSVEYDENYILQGYSFAIESKNVTSAPTPYDGLILTQSKARAWDTKGAPATAVVADPAGFCPTEGDYSVILGIQGYSKLTKQIIAKVTRGNIGNGDLYTIVAYDFRINIKDAAALQAKTGTAYESEFLTRSNAKSYLRTDSAFAQNGHPALSNDGGFKTAVFPKPDEPGYPAVVQVELWVAEDHTAKVIINVTVSNGWDPWIEVPDLKAAASGSVFGPAQFMDGVEYGDVEDPKSLLVVDYNPKTINTSVPGAVYEITYRVTDTEENWTEATGYVIVGKVFGDYGVSAQNFVTTVKSLEAAGSYDDVILSRSHAKGIHVVRDGSGKMTGIEDWPAVVKDSAGFTNAVGTYAPIKIGVAEVAAADLAEDITGRVIDKDVISNDPDPSGEVKDKNTDDPSDTNRYIVAGNNVVIGWVQAGELQNKTDSITKAKLIDLAEAEGFRISNTGTISGFDVDVKLNGIKQNIDDINAGNGRADYNVTFIPKGIGGVEVTVVFTVAADQMPVITIDGPLRITKTAASMKLNRAKLLEGVTVTDPDSPQVTIADVVITDKTGAFPSIDSSKTGVTRVTYTVADPVLKNPDGTPATTVASRAVIVDDGRFIEDEDAELLIGAKNFVVSVDDLTFTGSADDALRLSWAEAYNYEGEELDVELISTLPTGFANKEIGTYSFTFGIVGESSPVVTITGEVVDADVIDLNGDPYGAMYALIASNFTINVVAVPPHLNADGSAKPESLISLAKARVIKLIPADPAPTPTVTVFDNGGFTDRKNTTPGYEIVFGINGFARDKYAATIIGEVTYDGKPTISVSTPYELVFGSAWDTATAMTEVSAWDPGDGNLTNYVTYYPKNPARDVDGNKPGIYQVVYEVTNSGGETVTAERSVVVNDGRYVIGKGRILEAKSFVIKLADVPTNALAMKAHLVGMTDAHLYDGTTGDELPPSLINIASGGYNKTVGTYAITVSAPDNPASAGTLSKNVKGVVINADVIDEQPLDPDDPTGTKVIVYGSNASLRTSEAAVIAADTTNALLINALKAGAYIVDVTDPSGAVTPQDVYIIDSGGFAAVVGDYTITVADVSLSPLSPAPSGSDGVTAIDLTATVTTGEVPEIAPQRPIIIPISKAGGLISDTQKKGSSTARDKEDGDLTSKIIVVNSPAIPADQAGVYPVTLRVTDSDGNPATATTVVVIDDGNFVYGDNYVLYARDFTIARANVNTGNRSAQIIAQSAAFAYRLDGARASVAVSDFGGYTNVGGVYKPRVYVTALPSLTRQITATVTVPVVSYRVSFNANGGYLTGPSAMYVQTPSTSLGSLPSSPIRVGYTFVSWRTDDGRQFTSDYPVTRNMTVSAQWQANPLPPSGGGNNYYYSSNTTVDGQTPPIQPRNTYVAVKGKELPTETVELKDEETATSDPGTWALFNLCAVVLSLLLALFFLVRFFADRRKDEEYNEEEVDYASLSAMTPERRAAVMARLEEDRQAQADRQRANASKDKAFYVNAPVLLIVVAAFVEALIIFFTTSKFGVMEMVDGFSIPLSLIVMAQLVVPMVAAMLWNRNKSGGNISPKSAPPSVYEA